LLIKSTIAAPDFRDFSYRLEEVRGTATKFTIAAPDFTDLKSQEK
jgi:hypothetical protein